jgi:hypothetical protein
MPRKHVLTITLTETYQTDDPDERANFDMALNQTLGVIRDTAWTTVHRFCGETVRVETERTDAR